MVRVNLFFRGGKGGGGGREIGKYKVILTWHSSSLVIAHIPHNQFK